MKRFFEPGKGSQNPPHQGDTCARNREDCQGEKGHGLSSRNALLQPFLPDLEGQDSETDRNIQAVLDAGHGNFHHVSPPDPGFPAARPGPHGPQRSNGGRENQSRPRAAAPGSCSRAIRGRPRSLSCRGGFQRIRPVIPGNAQGGSQGRFLHVLARGRGGHSGQIQAPQAHRVGGAEHGSHIPDAADVVQQGKLGMRPSGPACSGSLGRRFPGLSGNGVSTIGVRRTSGPPAGVQLTGI